MKLRLLEDLDLRWAILHLLRAREEATNTGTNNGQLKALPPRAWPWQGQYYPFTEELCRRRFHTLDCLESATSHTSIISHRALLEQLLWSLLRTVWCSAQTTRDQETVASKLVNATAIVGYCSRTHVESTRRKCYGSCLDMSSAG